MKRRRSTWDPLWRRHCAVVREHGVKSAEARKSRLALARWHERQGLEVPRWVREGLR